MNREEVMKALEICTGPEQDATCTFIPCPYGDVGSCQQLLMAHAFELIKELTQANEQLIESYDHLEKTKDCLIFERSNFARENVDMRSEIDYWKKRTKDRVIEHDQVVNTSYKHGWVDSARFFAEKLGKHFCHDPVFLGVEQRLIMDVIDQIAREMMEYILNKEID